MYVSVHLLQGRIACHSPLHTAWCLEHPPQPLIPYIAQAIERDAGVALHQQHWGNDQATNVGTSKGLQEEQERGAGKHVA